MTNEPRYLVKLVVKGTDRCAGTRWLFTPSRVRGTNGELMCNWSASCPRRQACATEKGSEVEIERWRLE